MDAGGRRGLVLRATKIILVDPPAIHRANEQSRFSLARKCSKCIFEFFNRIAKSCRSALRPISANDLRTLVAAQPTHKIFTSLFDLNQDRAKLPWVP